MDRWPSNIIMEIWLELWDEDLAKKFQKHDQSLEEGKIFKIEVAGSEEMLVESKEEFVIF